MPRSIWKGPLVDNYVIKLFKKSIGKLNVLIKIRSRRSMITRNFVGYTFGVYNGKVFVPVKVSESMVGHRFGEFAPTRTFNGHSGDKKVVKR